MVTSTKKRTPANPVPFGSVFSMFYNQLTAEHDVL